MDEWNGDDEEEEDVVVTQSGVLWPWHRNRGISLFREEGGLMSISDSGRVYFWEYSLEG